MRLVFNMIPLKQICRLFPRVQRPKLLYSRTRQSDLKDYGKNRGLRSTITAGKDCSKAAVYGLFGVRDSGSLIMMKSENDEKPRPIGIILVGTANRGRLNLKVGQPPENWTSGVDLGRLLNLLELDLITTSDALKDAG
ncbi:hypothetical protein Tco_0675906, partial [Tanacetum coccineum]